MIVEDVEAARTALKWALSNLMRYGDLITLLHVFPSTRSKSSSKVRHRRLKGYQLALTFKDICITFPNVSVPITDLIDSSLFLDSFCYTDDLILGNDNHFYRVMLQTKVEIIVTEGDQEGRKIAAMVREIGASVLVVGLHNHSFLYK